MSIFAEFAGDRSATISATNVKFVAILAAPFLQVLTLLLPQETYENLLVSFTHALPKILPLENFAIFRNFNWNISLSIAAILATNFTATISRSFAVKFAGNFTVKLEILQICHNYCSKF
jgi:hypothetical protein